MAMKSNYIYRGDIRNDILEILKQSASLGFKNEIEKHATNRYIKKQFVIS